jgi:hypothetical protein
VISALAVLTFAVIPGVAQEAFQASSLAQAVRGEGQTETVGAVVLSASAAGTIVSGSSITFVYPSTITNSPGNSALSGKVAGTACNPGA